MNAKTKLILALCFLTILVISYSNHFTNGFYFDDSHTIVNNSFIKDISNIPLFFTDIKYFGTNLGNQAYNPVLVSLNTIDYWLAGEYNPVYFHVSIFFWYVVQLVLMFFLFRHIFNYSLPNKHNDLIALFIVAFYGMHTANAETINYIIMRSDSFSTLCIVASFVLFQIQSTRKWHIYLVPMIIGLGTKETGLMFSLILFFYILLFEQKVSLIEFILLKKRTQVLKAVTSAAPAIIVSIALFAFMRYYFLPKDAFLLGGDPPYPTWNYFMTQWQVIAHYIGNFILPLNLSVDKDFQIIKTIFDQRVLLGFALIMILVAIAFVTSRSSKMRPISFGIIWFFLALAPTSSFKPFGQIANDHRVFFPYIGLALALGWYAGLMLIKHQAFIQSRLILKRSIPTLAMVVILLHAYGTHQRNAVWSSSESLWYDATIKCPKNGRVMMNYGLTQMSKGKYDVALEYFTIAEELLPYWAYIHINMGILKNAMGHPAEAENYFLNAIKYQPNVAESYYYYGRWLIGQNRKETAKEQLAIGKNLSPGHAGIIQLLKKLSTSTSETGEDKVKALLQLVEEEPTPENYINLSLAYYQQGMYQECIDACTNALAEQPDYVFAYNNMCTAYNALGEWDKALAACQRAIEISPDYQLAKNNLQMVLDNKPK